MFLLFSADVLCLTLSSFHSIISLSFCSFSYNGVCFDQLKPCVNDFIDSQKGSNGDGKLQIYGQDNNENLNFLELKTCIRRKTARIFTNQNMPLV